MVSITHQVIFTILAIIRERQLSHESINSRDFWYNKYDFIVVGAGTAGSVVAARLAEDANKQVLLIEAGGPQNIVSDIPAFVTKTIDTELDWNYPIVPQKHAFWAFQNDSRTINRGKSFGGCSMHNEMNYYRESPEYFDFWTDITRVQNWTYSHVLPYFRKSENNLDQSLVAKEPLFHKTGGPLTVSTAVPNQILKAYISAANLSGYPITHPDGRDPFGTAVFQTTIKDGVRQSTSLVFLENNRRRNLHILGQTLVTKILFIEKRAVGIQFFRDNIFQYVFANKEIIVSAGTIGSPHLLLLSGIGPREHLQQMKIPVVSDLKVGDNFIQAPGLVIGFDIKDQSLVERPDKTLENYYKYFVQKSGPLTYIAAAESCFPQVAYKGHPQLPNGFVLARTGFVGTDLEEIVKEFKVKEEWRDYFRPYLNRSNLYMTSVLKKPQKTGTIRLASKDPFQYPVLDPCILCSDQDLTDLVKTVKLSLDIFLSPLLQSFIELYAKPIPGCNPCPNDYFCDTYIRCMLQTYSDKTYPMGGCRIGVANDSEAVVDNKLRVFGVSGLRVIDSSIIPVGTDQSTAITIMIGEYGADMIKEFNGMNRK